MNDIVINFLLYFIVNLKESKYNFDDRDNEGNEVLEIKWVMNHHIQYMIIVLFLKINKHVRIISRL